MFLCRPLLVLFAGLSLYNYVERATTVVCPLTNRINYDQDMSVQRCWREYQEQKEELGEGEEEEEVIRTSENTSRSRCEGQPISWLRGSFDHIKPTVVRAGTPEEPDGHLLLTKQQTHTKTVDTSKAFQILLVVGSYKNEKEEEEEDDQDEG